MYIQTLNDTLEKNRKEIIYGVKQQIGIGLSQGDRYTTMAKRIDDNLNIGYRKAMTIARTESHRVMEEGQLDSALAIDKVAREAGSDLIYVKTWRTMADERVRPQMKATKTKGKRSRMGKPNHVKMEDITLAIEEKFDLGGGVTANAPLQSGVAGHDINCRCYLEYDFLTAEEYLEKTGKVWGKSLTKDDDSGIMEVEGAISGALNPLSKKAEIHAEKYYASVRKMTTDVENIARNTGYKSENIKKIKEYVFIQEHKLINGTKRFDPSYEMAQSWQRLIEGKNIQKQDIVLLKHEFVELKLVNHGYSQDEAHVKVSKKYSFVDYL